jgi:WD40 repeat protein
MSRRDDPTPVLHRRAPAPQRAEPDTHRERAADEMPPSSRWPLGGPASDPSTLQPGTRIGPYEIIRLLGAGGMGCVQLARDTRLGRLAALKFLLKPRSGGDTKRFLVEARATAQLGHENVVVIYDVGEHRGWPFMALEYLRGESLQAWIATRKAHHDGSPGTLVPPRKAVELMLPVVRALTHAHDHGIVHRDLKPGNVMITELGTVKVLDFGIAKILGQEEPRSEISPRAQAASLTQTGAAVGTTTYMAPEQWEGDVDHRADLWAVGLMLHELLFGTSPVRTLLNEGGAAALAEELRNVDARLCNLHEEHPELGKLGGIVDRCLSKRREERPESAAELLCDLTAVMGQEGGVLDWEADPFAGLAAFQETDAARFFGRDRAIHQAVLRLADQPLLPVIGPSGAGKSSFVRAGLIPALKKSGDAWETFALRPGAHPLRALAELVAARRWQSIEQDGSDSGPRSLRSVSADDREAIIARLQEEPGFLGHLLRTRAHRKRERILLFVDQLEEAYTLASESERRAFFACLAGVADDPGSPLRVVLTLRSDFLDRLGDAQSVLPEVGRGFLLMPLDREELRDALTRPIAARNHHFDPPGLADAMLDELADARGPLPLLQFTAAQLWEKRDRAKRTLTEESYRELGGIGGTLARHGDALISAMNPRDKVIARSLLLRLVTPERTRALLSLREIGEMSENKDELRRVLDRLLAARLLSLEGNGEEDGVVEIVHESLVVHWPTLTRWLDEAAEDAVFIARLRSAAQQWRAAGERTGLLWTGEAAEEARRFSARGSRTLSRSEARFLSAVLTFDKRERTRRRRGVAAAFILVVAAALTVTGLAISARDEARRASQQAERADRSAAEAKAQEAETARSARRARNASLLLAARERQADPTLSIALAREIDPGAEPPGWAEHVQWTLGVGVSRWILPHEEGVLSAVWSPDGTRLVTTSRSPVLRIWRANSFEEPLLLRGHGDSLRSAAWSPDGRRIVSGSLDKTVRIWNADGTGTPVVLRGHTDAVWDVAFDPSGSRVASASVDRTVRIWDADGAGEPIVLRGHTSVVHSISWSPDGRRLATSSYDGTVRIWSADGLHAPSILSGDGSPIFAVAWSPDGHRLATGGYDTAVKVWNADGMGEPIVLRGHEAPVLSLAWDPKGARLASGARDHTVRLWDTADLREISVFRGHLDAVTRVAWSPDGLWVASASADKQARIWQAVDPVRPRVLRGHTSAAWWAEWSPDGKRVCSTSSDKTLRVWNADGSGKPLVLRGHGERVYSCMFSPDGQRIVTASADGTSRIWRADGSGTPAILRADDEANNDAVFSPDGEHVATAGDREVRLWDVDGIGEPVVVGRHDDEVVDLSFSPDGHRIVSVSDDRTLKVWNAHGREDLLASYTGMLEPVGVAFSLDGRRIATGSLDRLVRVWNADGSGTPVVLRGHMAVAGAAGQRAWSADGRLLLSYSDDATLRIWDLDSGSEWLVLRNPSSSVAFNSASWSPDGRSVVGASVDGNVWIWDEVKPIRTTDDPRLWLATTYCPSIEERQRLLNVTESAARADLDRCMRRVREAWGDGVSQH